MSEFVPNGYFVDKAGTKVEIYDASARALAAANALEITEDRKKIAALTEDKVSNVNGFLPDENGAVTIKYDATSERGYRHNGLSEYPKSITVYSDERYTNNPYIFLGKNYWPATEYVDGPYDRHGMSLQTDKHNITVTGTATQGSSYRLPDADGQIYWDISDIFKVGEKYDLYVFAKASEYASPFCKVEIYDANKSRLVFKQQNIAAGGVFGKNSGLIIPEGAKYAMFHVAYNNGATYNNTVFPVLVKANTTVINNQAFVDGVVNVATEDKALELCTAPYESAVQYQLALKEYIDAKSSTVDFDMAEIEKTMSFVTPEMFGAYADGLHDDTAAVQACIDYAVANNKKVFGAGQYITSSPITIVGNYCSIEINGVLYGGTEHAVRIDGTQNTVRITRITSQGIGMLLKSATNYTSYNDINVETIVASKGCVKYEAVNKSMVGNRFAFGYLETAQEYNCIECNSDDWRREVFIGNNNFVGGRFVNGNWGAYNLNGNDVLTTCQFEGVKNAVYYCGAGVLRVVAPRYAELCYFCYDYEQSNRPKIAGKGTLFKIAFPSDYPEDMSKTCCVDLAPAAGRIMPANIDLTEALVEYSDGELVNKNYPGPALVRAKLEGRFTNAYADEFYTFGQHIIIKQPSMYRTKHIVAGDAGYAGDYTITDTEDEFMIYTEYIVDDAGCDYKLPPSYDVIGMDKFIVTQQAGAHCILRDWRGTVIFNGETLGEGRYELRARLKDGTLIDYYDNRNQVWEITKLNSPIAIMPQEN